MYILTMPDHNRVSHHPPLLLYWHALSLENTSMVGNSPMIFIFVDTMSLHLISKISMVGTFSLQASTPV